MPDWQFATGLSIFLLVAFTAHVFYRRPPGPLWPTLPMVFVAALLFSTGDVIAEVSSGSQAGLWLGLTMLYAGLFSFVPAWWGFTKRYVEIYEPETWSQLSRFPMISTRFLMLMNLFFVVAMATSPWHGLFLEANPGARSTYGPIWFLAAGINYLVILGTFGVHLWLSFRAKDQNIRSQCRYIAAAVAVPLIANVIFVSSPTPLPYDPTALGMAMSCGIFLFAVSRLDLFALETLSVPDILSEDTDAILFLKSDYRLLYANERASRLLDEELLVRGASMREVLEQHVPSFDIDHVLKSCLSKRDAVIGGAHHLVSRSGREQWLQIDVTRFRWHRGRSMGFCIRLRDRTDLHEATATIHEHANLLEAIDQATGEGLVVQDSTGRVRYANDAFGRLWDIPIVQIRTWGHERLLTEVSSRLWGSCGREFAPGWHRNQEEFDSDFRLTSDVQLADGRIVEVCTFPIQSAQGFTGRVWRTTDVTRQRQDAQAMIHSQKLEGLGVLAGGIAHDFNNLLVAMLGNAELARESVPLDSPVFEYLRDVEASAERAAELTAQMLAYTGKTNFETEEIDLSELIRDVGELLSVSIPKNVKLEYDLDQNVPLLRGGPGQLRQIAMNLVTNAADAIGEREPGRVVVETGVGRPEALGFSASSLGYGSTPDSPVFLRVFDDGEGMDQETLNRIFDPFFTTKVKGRGLGLAATLGIIQSHEGSLFVESTKGQGTAFTVFLPFRPGEVASLEVSTRSPSRSYAGRTALVVDDEPTVRHMLGKMLQALDFSVLEACDGYEALEIFEQHLDQIDLVVLDMNMPGMDGEATWWSLRNKRSDLPILLSSGYPEQMINLEGVRSAKLDAFIQKPYRRRDLCRRLEFLLDGSND